MPLYDPRLRISFRPESVEVCRFHADFLVARDPEVKFRPLDLLREEPA